MFGSQDPQAVGEQVAVLGGGLAPFAGAVGRRRSSQGIMNTVVFACRGRWAGG